MTPQISFDTSEMSREDAHRLVDAAYASKATSAPESSEAERAQAAQLVALSVSPGWRALMATLERDGEASIPEVAARAGVTPRGLLVAIGRAVRGKYSAYDWQWSGSGVDQDVSIAPGLQAALAEAGEADFFNLDLDADGGA